jgi:hypothetical protein
MKSAIAKCLSRAVVAVTILGTVMTVCPRPSSGADGKAALLGKSGDWEAWSVDDASGALSFCYMTNKTVTRSEDKKRGEIAVFITHWQSDKTRNVVSIAAGYAYKKGSRPTVSIDGQVFKLAQIAEQKSPQEREMAWTEDQATDDAIAAALQKGATLVVEGESQRGTLTKDTYSLKGSGEAYSLISAKCTI